MEIRQRLKFLKKISLPPFISNSLRYVNKHYVRFITLHYAWIIGCAIIGSICIYPRSADSVKYIDALLFATGAATQGGLNTVLLADLNIWQQFVMYFIPLITSPLIMHASVVVVRVYLFHSRCSRIVREGKRLSLLRRTMSRRQSNDNVESSGVHGREIRVLLSQGHHFGNTAIQNTDTNNLSFTSHRRGSSIHYTSETENAVADDGEGEPLEKQPSSESDHGASNAHDIRFGNLPRPARTEDAEKPFMLDEGNDQATNGIRRRAISFGGAPRDIKAKMRTTPTLDRSFARTHTFERILSNTFRRRRDGSPASRSSRRSHIMPYLTYDPTVGRNSAFISLTKEQMDELGGVEYHAMKLLLVILLSYYAILHLTAMICFLGFIYTAKSSQKVLEMANINKGWWAVFTAASVSNDAGFTLTSDSFISIRESVFILLVSCFFIPAGNTAIPVFLRVWIWTLKKLTPNTWRHHESLEFLLDHPRRCFTLLFPREATIWLLSILLIMNAVDLFFWGVLDINNSELEAIPVGYRILDGIFQSISTRTAGFTVIDLSKLSFGVQVSFMVMMYISVFPLAISLRRTNVYEEQSIGVYAADDDEDNHTSFVGTHIRRQLSFDLWFLTIAVFIISIAENGPLSNSQKPAFDMWRVIFEVISAYGTVGLSLGYPNVNTSFCGQFGVIGKLVIIVCMIRGRHRGLPYRLDKAIMVPSEKALQEEAAEFDGGRGRRFSMSR